MFTLQAKSSNSKFTYSPVACALVGVLLAPVSLTVHATQEQPVEVQHRVKIQPSQSLQPAQSLQAVQDRTVQKTQLAPSNQPVPVTKPAILPQNDVIRPSGRPRIQVAILLDTSSSMDGLIDQTRNQLWQVVNEFSAARQNGIAPILEVALFEYGNDGLPESSGYVRKLNQFTQELDRVSEGLFSLTTNGGSEYCGLAIKTAVNGLQWSQSSNDIKTIFIAGNEPFTQGPVHYQEAVKQAYQMGITVNTIFAGGHQQGVGIGWQSGALLAGGDYMSIDANRRVVHITAPQDKKIAELNAKLNQTYIPYGAKGQESAKRQMEQDAMSSNISTGLLAKRAKSKSSSFYKNSSWDLVDAIEEGEVQEDELAAMEEASLPEPMREMSASERKEYVLEQAEERKKIKMDIAELGRARDAFVAKKKSEQANVAPSVSDALTQSIRKQAKQKNFKLENDKLADKASQKSN
ncbi:VWA domain-containing protein [Aliikangiella coralliicola]|uniref:VWA domain-containing protein n=1 Tax=Aliikangiella coralliicola TaxID=2592383 RepID=A0A545U7V1_9GAMM|nr:vWA domain-containing protein [Aliikangiella coralliicola]TQV85545.1 VWA domain-containing protein [Aliikangiella coralliicola]